MLSFITFKGYPEKVEIVADEQGIQDLIKYLEGIKRDKDHMHLIIDSEIDPFPINEDRKEEVFYAKHVRLEFNNSDEWKNNS